MIKIQKRNAVDLYIYILLIGSKIFLEINKYHYFFRLILNNYIYHLLIFKINILNIYIYFLKS
jgi:hypothetical protein